MAAPFGGRGGFMNKQDFRIVYMGTPDFAVEGLKALVEGGYNIVGVVTMPDKPMGRHQDTLQPSPVKVYAQEHGLKIMQPVKLKDPEFVEELHSLRTPTGLPYRLIALPMPQAIYEDGQRLPATYANFVVINGAVIVPTYGQPENDTLAAQLIGSAFPDRDIVCIDASTVVRQHGSLHCLTMQYY